MKNIDQLILESNNLGIKLWVEEDNLCYRAPKGLFPPEIKTELKERKAELISFLQSFKQSDHFPYPVTLKPIRSNGSRFPLYFIQIEQQSLINPFVKYLDSKYSIYSISNLGEIMASLLAHKFNSFDATGTTVESLATQYIDALLKFQPQEPYYLLGFSFGGVVAYEMAIQLKVMGKKVEHLILLDTANPLSTMNIQELKKERIIKHLKGLIKSGPVYIKERIPWQISRLKYWLSKKYDQLFNKKLFDLSPLIVLDIMKYHNQLQKVYIPQKYNGKVTLFSAKEGNSPYQDVWGKLTDNTLNVIDIPGTHDGMFEEPNVQILIEALEKLFFASTELIESRSI